jgi:diguanylate cyclase (GGDEF)-like protein
MADESPVSGRPARLFLLCGLGAVAAYLFVPMDIRYPWLYRAIAFAGIAAQLAGIGINRPRIRLPWILFAAGCSCFFVGDWLFDHYGTVDHATWADVFYLAAYPLLFGGLLTIVRVRNRKRNLSSLIDATTIAVAAGLAAWVFLMAPYVHDHSTNRTYAFVLAAYPLCDVLLLGVAARLAFGGMRITASYALLGLAMFTLLLADLVYDIQQLNGTWKNGHTGDLLYLTCYVAFGAAALAPSMRVLALPTIDKITPGLSPQRLGLLAASTVTAPLILFVQHERGVHNLEIPMVALCSVALFALVVGRMAGLVRRQQRSTEREHTLRTSVSTLAAAEDHDLVCQAAVDAAVALVGEAGDVRASLLLGSGAERVVFATAGSTGAGALQVTFPLQLKAHSLGELLLESQAPLPTDLDEALRSLASQVVLALESIERTETLVEERKELESELVRTAHEDPVTGLPNRTHFLERVDYALRRRSPEAPVSVLIVDLDDFKTVNDSLGHVAGDELLRLVSGRLLSCIRAGDTCARLGGDEWGILLEGPQQVPPTAVAERSIGALERSFVLLGQHEVFAHASIGTAVAPDEDDIDAADLLRNAEVAMVHAKQGGKGGYTEFEPGMRAAVAERLALKAELERAVAAQEFLLHYQPIVQLETAEICGVEALIRWQHPERGLVPPYQFIPLAEETGLIVPLGRWVLIEALHQARVWQNRFNGGAPLLVSVNLSGRQLDHDSLVGDVTTALEKTGIEPQSVILEITETTLMEDVEAAIGRLHELKNLGVQIAIDDFGTGYSSLQYLRQFPADIIKVAKPFVDGVVARGSDEYRIADAIVRLGETFNLRALAEGIELPEQREMLRELRCELGQGYHFAKPLEPAGVEALLRAQAEATALV